MHQPIDALGTGRAQEGHRRRREIGLGDQPGAQGVVDVVVDVGDAVADADDAALEGGGTSCAGVAQDAVAHLPGQVQTPAVVLDHLDHPQALLVVAETPRQPVPSQDRVQGLLAGVAEGSVAEVVAERDRLGQVLVQAQRPGDAAGDARHLERVRQPGAVVVALGGDEDLGLVLQPPERLAVDDAVAVALVGGAEACTAPRRARARASAAERCAERREAGLVGLDREPDPASRLRVSSTLRQPVPPLRSAALPASRSPGPPVFSSSTACAAASRASGTRYGLQLT